MSWAGCHCEGRRTQRRLTGSNTATSGPPVFVVPGGQIVELSSPLLSSALSCCPSLSLTVPHCPRLDPRVAGCRTGPTVCAGLVVAGEAGTRARAHLTSPLTRSVKCPATDPLGVILT